MIDFQVVEYFGVCINQDVVVDFWMLIFVFFVGVIEGNILQNGYIIFQNGGVVDYDVCVMVDENVVIDWNGWVNVDLEDF